MRSFYWPKRRLYYVVYTRCGGGGAARSRGVVINPQRLVRRSRARYYRWFPVESDRARNRETTVLERRQRSRALSVEADNIIILLSYGIVNIISWRDEWTRVPLNHWGGSTQTVRSVPTKALAKQTELVWLLIDWFRTRRTSRNKSCMTYCVYLYPAGMGNINLV